MGQFRRKKEGELEFDKLPKGSYYFSGQEGFVKVEVNKDGDQTWDLKNWFSSLDPDKTEAQRNKIIEDIKRRLNAHSGLINPKKKDRRRLFQNPFNK